MNKDKIELLAALGGALAGGTAAILLLNNQHEKHAMQRRPRITWVLPWLEKRDEEGAFAKLLPELRSGDRNEQKLFAGFVRMWKDDFDHLLDLIEPTIEKQNTTMRNAIRPGARLALTLHYLATGSSFRTLQYPFRIPQCTITTIIPEVLDAIYNALAPTYLKVCSCSFTCELYMRITYFLSLNFRSILFEFHSYFCRCQRVQKNGWWLKRSLMNCGISRIASAPSMGNMSSWLSHHMLAAFFIITRAAIPLF